MNISLLIKMIRHLDNRITISCLAADLGISESTLNRCLTGKWSNSIKSSSVCYAVESYLNDYFDGDEQKFLDNIRSFCKTNNIPFDKYNELYSKEGLLPLFSEFYEEAYLQFLMLGFLAFSLFMFCVSVLFFSLVATLKFVFRISCII